MKGLLGDPTILLPIAMVLFSAAVHAFWNLQVKKADNKVLFSYLYVWSAILIYTPLFAVMLPGTIIPWQGWACILTTGSVYCFYFLLLAKSYSYGDLSHTYPLARGIAPALTLLWAMAFLAERPSFFGWIGILLVLLSMYLFHPPTARGLSIRESVRRLGQPASIAALATGLSISIYSVVDKVGVSFVSPGIYIYLTFCVAGLLLSPFYLRRFGFLAIRNEIRISWRQALAVGFMIIFAYLVVLFAMQLTQVSYIVPLRSTSILFAVLLGFEVLGEEQSRLKVLAALTMVAGVAFIALS